MKTSNKIIIIALTALLIGATACTATQVTPTATATSVPPTSVPPTATLVPLYQQVTLTSVASEIDNKAPDYKITLQTPTLTGSDDPRVKVFNDQVAALIKQTVEDFKNNVSSMPPIPVSAGSGFDVQYKLLSKSGSILSIKFEMLGYVSGAAHPYHLNPTFNFDIEKGKVLSLSDLFLPNADYLSPISKYCVMELTKRDIGFTSDFVQGADPKPENYKNWNINADGLVITFDEYQVAAYVAGPQVVTIPYAKLKNVIDPNGPLAQFVE